ncbi:MAG: MMPL family transporter [Solobacterium sp.]|nr:MMPL family transporter [Solobacterium sp.]
MDETQNQSGFMVRLSTWIVDKRNLIFLITVIGLLFSAVSRTWVEVENDLTSYLPEESDTKQALNVMDEQFVTFGSADVMVASVTLDEAQALKNQITDLEGVQSVTFDETTQHYADVSALYSVTFDYPDDDARCLEALDRVKASLSSYDIFVVTDLGNAKGDIIDREVSIIMIYVAIIIVIVLTLTSETYAEVPVLILTFVIAMILNLGSNFLLGRISFVSNSVTSILQLALSLDYAVILSNRFKEEHRNLPIREAVITALSKAIPEIGASSLTTIGGLVAMMFMQFRLGPDMAICLIKSIFFALLATFTVMPGLLVLFGPLMDRTAHKSFVPKIPFVGKFDYATRWIVPPVFLVLVIAGYHFSSLCPYAYGYGGIVTPKMNEVQIAQNLITDTFDRKNMIAVIVPGNDYAAERKLYEDLMGCSEVDHSTALVSVDALGGYKLADALNPREFAELAGIDYEKAQLLYSAYAVSDSDYSRLIGQISDYEVPLIDMFLYVCDAMHDGYISFDEETQAKLEDAYTLMKSAKLQLSGEDYDRMLFYLNLPEGGDTTYRFLDTMRSMIGRYYDPDDIYLAGNSTNEYDFKKSFSIDNTVVTLVSILIVLVVLLFTFKSVGMPLLLILVIEGAIMINFSFPYLLNTQLFFLGYLVVSSIQMGANIDYAIVIGSRYQEIKNETDRRTAIIETMNFAFPTIITSGTILAASGILIGQMTSEATICGIGQCLGRGTIISILLVMFVLPQILLVGDKLIDRTSFEVRHRQKTKSAGMTRVDGFVSGEISGKVSGYVNALVEGDVNVTLVSGSAETQSASEGSLPAEAAPEGTGKAPVNAEPDNDSDKVQQKEVTAEHGGERNEEDA